MQQTAKIFELSRFGKTKQELAAKSMIRAELMRFAKEQAHHAAMYHGVRRLMTDSKLNHVQFPKLNIQVWFKDGRLVFDITDEEMISVDNDCPYCGEYFYTNSTTVYVHRGLNHDRYVYACQCQRYFAVTRERDE